MGIDPPSGKAFACVSFLGAASLCYLLGAAAMHFQLPGAGYLRNAFIGSMAWSERGHGGSRLIHTALDDPPGNAVTVDRPDKTADGFTLYTSNCGPWAALIDMKGNLVHQWKMPFAKAWPNPRHVDPFPGEQFWYGFHLYPNGDLLAVYQANSDTPYGYGLIKLDKNSKLLWRYSGNVHHEIDVGEDGTIYALTQKLAGTAPAGMDFIPQPYIADAVVLLSPQGKVLDHLPILETLRDSQYASTLELTTRTQLAHSSGAHQLDGDFTHPNSVKVLREALAPQFPLFKAGQVLLSLRNMHALAVLDVRKRSVVWLTQGCWRGQHAADFLANGHLLFYDNQGAKYTRVLEVDPGTQAMPWSYASEGSRPFLSEFMGKTQRLPNGNTLIVHPGASRIFEVTAEKEVVWESICLKIATIVEGNNNDEEHSSLAGLVASAWRYPADQLVFLKGIAHARP